MTQQQIDNWFNTTYVLTGKDVARLQRQHKVTIRDLKKRTGFTLKRIRQIRNHGDDVALRGHAAIDWIEAITGSLPPRAKAAYIQRANSDCACCV